MRKYFRYKLLLLLIAVDIFSVQGQQSDPGLKVITEKFSGFCRTIPFEDIYLHSDRDTYIAGEYLWFKTYLFDRQGDSLSSGSSYAYIELLNQENRPVSRVKIRLDKGTGRGGFILPDSLSNGNYTLRAYTNWMKNFLPDGCFRKTISIYNLFSSKNFWTKEAVDKTDNTESKIDFFPEGGKITGGFKNRVGLRVYNKFGQGTGCKGYVIDQTSDTVTAVNVDSSGIGSFDFLPVAWNNYRLVTLTGKSLFNLPPLSNSGYALHVNYPDKNSLELIINTNKLPSVGSINYVYLIIQSRGNILLSNKEILKGNSTIINIPAETLHPGINQIIIFDSDAKPQGDRYVFKEYPEHKNMIIKTNDRSGKREKFNLEIDPGMDLISADGLSDYSISVSALEANNKSYNITDYMIPGNEFTLQKGPGKAFENLWDPPEKIDDILLTVKSNWIDWVKIMSDKLPALKYNFEKNGHFLSGTIKAQTNNPTYENKLIYLSIPGKIPVYKYSEIDSENRFKFFLTDKESTGDLILQPSDDKNSYSMVVESPFSDKYPLSAIIDSSSAPFNDEIIKLSTNYQVEKIYGISSTGNPDTLNPKVKPPLSVRFYGKPDQTIVMSDYISLPVMQEVFFELIPGLTIKTNKSNYGIYVEDPLTKSIYDKPPGLFIDGVFTKDPSAIINLDPELVEKIDVIKSEYIIGSVIFCGIINVITKAGDFGNLPLPVNAVRIKYKDQDYGLKFLSTDNSSEAKNNNRIPDFRNTLYWNPNLKPDKNGKILIDLTTSDFTSVYEIDIEGISGGRPVSVRKTFSIE